MRTRPLGPLEVTVVGLGCNNFGGRVDEAGTRAVIDAALDAGVTFFDTADIYGESGGSETLIGKALEGRRDQVVLATKFGKPMGDGATRRGSRDYIRAAIEASLERLQTDRDRSLPAPRGGPDTPLEETFGASRSSSPRARCARVGTSNYAPATVERASALAASLDAAVRLGAGRVLVARARRRA